jgi:hypothetical protein
MDDAEAFPDWPVRRDAIRVALAAREANLRHAGPLRPVRGAIVKPDSIVARVVAQSVFMDIAGDVKPRLMLELAGDPLDQFAAAWVASGGSPAADPGGDLDVAAVHRCQVAMFDEHGALWRWCERWGVPVWDDLPFWVAGADARTLIRFAADRAWGLVEAAHTLFRWRWHPVGPGVGVHFGHLFLYAPDVGDPELGLGRALSLPPQWWDPQREERATATKRILAELVRSVRAELGRIETEALRVGAPPPTKRTGLEHLAWIARYHFRGESYAAIARDVCVERQTVTEAVKAAAELVGLPLREPSRSGPLGRGA